MASGRASAGELAEFPAELAEVVRKKMIRLSRVGITLTFLILTSEIQIPFPVWRDTPVYFLAITKGVLQLCFKKPTHLLMMSCESECSWGNLSNSVQMCF